MTVKNTREPTKTLKSFIVKDGAPSARVMSSRVKNKKLKMSSRDWLSRHINDEFTQKSIQMGLRARSAFKVIEIQEKFNIAPQGSTVLDLGCAPGGWSQVLAQTCNIVGVDLLPCEGLPNVRFILGDFTDAKIKEDALSNGKFDVVLSDIAPNTTGHKQVDHLKIMQIIDDIIFHMPSLLNNSGNFACKVFQGVGTDELILNLRMKFTKVRLFKPKSSRRESKEIYIVCMGFENRHC